ncbi:MAG: hypothetical protein IJO98_02560 [Clostridia bacterium]|nr:hypothetical protein [Clostridia bacterium]
MSMMKSASVPSMESLWNSWGSAVSRDMMKTRQSESAWRRRVCCLSCRISIRGHG